MSSDKSAVSTDMDPLLLSKIKPELSARRLFSGFPGVALALLAAGAVALGALFPWETARVFVVVSTVFYLLFTVYKFALVYFSVSRTAEIRVRPEEIAALNPYRLPLYSILVPLYREGESARELVESLMRMDYPPEKLDVQLLLEEDDSETRSVVEQFLLPPWIRATIVPVSLPRTKPKACNVGLAAARGEYLVIYDAEDRPEPDQLKKAVIGFSRVRGRVICLQSKLNYYNPRQNLLTRWFAAEYSSWFDLALPGLCALGSVIPLGGTSNHFRTAELKALMGWDAFNVAEDCDLGVRIYRAGYATAMLDTTTWEEACAMLWPWIKQRTRWLKGYIQTYLVHMRRPLRLASQLGAWNFLHFNLLIGGIVLCFLLNPIFWILMGYWFVWRSAMMAPLFAGIVFPMASACLFVGNFAFVYSGMMGCYRRKYHDLVKYALLFPLYWVLMSFGGWRALFQLFSNPFEWEKTPHGLWKRPKGGA